jgi:putative NADPH-quinone reductase
MARRVCIVQGHPHGSGAHFCHALAEAYAEGAAAAGAEVLRLDIAALAPACLTDPAAFATEPPEPMAGARAAVRAADHLVFVFPLWLGTMPALLKAFLEQLARAEFALGKGGGRWPAKKLAGKSARLVVTMGMPAFAFRLFWGAAGVRCLRQGILGIAGVAPVRTSLIGGVDALDSAARAAWFARMAEYGRGLR